MFKKGECPMSILKEKMDNLKSLLEEEKDLGNKFDLETDRDHIEWKNGALIIRNGELKTANLSYTAFEQFSKMLKTPTSYLKKCSSDIASYILNNEIKKANQNNLVLRMTRHEDDKLFIRSVHSPSKILFDYEDMCDTVKRIAARLDRFGEFKIEKGSDLPSDNLWKLRMVLDGSEIELDEQEQKLIFAFDIIGSETGLVMPKLEPIIWQEWCTNGMKSWSRDKNSFFSLQEVKTNREQFMNKLDSYIILKWNEYSQKAEKFRKSTNIMYDKNEANKIFIKVLEKTGVSKNSSKQKLLIDRLNDSNSNRDMISLYRLTSTITEIARDISANSYVAGSENLIPKMMKLNNKSELLEQEAGRLIEAA